MAHVPKYVRVRNEIMADIRSGKYSAGDRLPTREELIKEYQVTRTTINQALKELVNSGVLATSKRGGTVATGKLGKPRIAFVSNMNRDQVLHNHNRGESGGLMMASALNSLSDDLELDFLNEATACRNIGFVAKYDRVIWMFPANETINKLREYKDKVILLNRYFQDFNYISTNHREAVKQMTLYNIDRCGADCQMIFLSVDSDEFVIKERREGFVDACSERRLFYRIFDFVPNDYAATLDFLMQLQFEPNCKIVMTSSCLAFTGAVIGMANRRGLKFNEDIFYSDFDNEFALQNTGVELVTAIQDYSEISNCLVKALQNFDGSLIQKFVPCRLEFAGRKLDI